MTTQNTSTDVQIIDSYWVYNNDDKWQYKMQYGQGSVVLCEAGNQVDLYKKIAEYHQKNYEYKNAYKQEMAEDLVRLVRHWVNDDCPTIEHIVDMLTEYKNKYK